MNTRPIILATAIALALTGSVLAEERPTTTPITDFAPIEAAFVEKAPSGFFVDAPLINNMTVMIVRITNDQNEVVLETRSHGEPVELLASGLPDGDYYYQIKTIYRLQTPTGTGPDFTDEGMRREGGTFTIKHQEIMQPQLNPATEELGFVDKLSSDAIAILGAGLSLLVADASAQDLFASSNTPSVGFDDTTSSSGTEFEIRVSAVANNSSGDWQLLDLVGFGSPVSTVIDINTVENSAIANSWVVSSNGDQRWANSGMFFDRSTQELAIGTTLTPGELTISSFIPDIVLIDESDTSEARLQLNGGYFRLFTRPNNTSSTTIPFAAHMNAPTDSILIQANGDVRLGPDFYYNASSGALNLGDAVNISETFNTLQLTSATAPEVFFLGPGNEGFEIELSNGLGFHADTDGDGSSNVFNIFKIEGDAPSGSLRIDDAGNIGMGTIAPVEAVDVARTAAAARFQLTSVSSTGSEAAQFIQRRARAGDTAVQTGDNLGLFSFRGHNGSAMTGTKAGITVKATQNWTAGGNGTRMLFQTTTNGSNTLNTVMEITHDGKVLINGTELNVPDYVFEDDYDLMSLDQLAAYIEENKHLPGVASANEVNSGGLDLAGSQLSILEKVEELTLYTLQQHDELKQMHAVKSAHRALLTAYHAQQDELQSLKSMLNEQQQLVNQLLQSQQGKSLNVSLK